MKYLLVLGIALWLWLLVEGLWRLFLRTLDLGGGRTPESFWRRSRGRR
ncbi:MAG: hypothetical protein SF066_12305 [Thermoanaerobaculia bacterium]|nr:hypothetical protein [Thermoanaerobaculia bacterium]